MIYIMAESLIIFISIKKDNQYIETIVYHFTIFIFFFERQ